MKKIAILLLTSIYLLPAIGFSIGMHICGNRVTALNFENFGRNGCPCGVEMKGDCCKNIHVAFQITDNQKAATELTISKYNFSKFISESSLPVQFISLLQPIIFEYSDYHAPPPTAKRPVYLNNRVFRI